MKKKQKETLLNREKKGSGIVVAIIISAVISTFVVSYLKIVSYELNRAEDAFLKNAVINLAEAAAEEAVWALNHNDWSLWKDVSGKMVRGITGFDLKKGKVGTIYVMVEDRFTETPTLSVEGIVTLTNGQIVSRQLKIESTKRILFANGLTADDEIEFDEDGASSVSKFDAYDSAAGPYHVVSNRTDSGAIGAPSVDISDSDIYGYVSSDPSNLTYGAGAKIYGAGSVTDIDTARITKDYVSDFRDYSAPTLGGSPETSLPAEDNKVIGNSSGSPTVEYSLSSMSIEGGQTLIVEGPVIIVVSGDVLINGTMRIETTGSLMWYVGGNLTFNNGSYSNLTDDATQFIIFGTNTLDGDKSFLFTNTSQIAMGIYAPNAVVEFNNEGGDLFGAVLGYTIEIEGTRNFHYDEQLKNFKDDSYTTLSWQQIIKPSDKVDFTLYITEDDMEDYSEMNGP